MKNYFIWRIIFQCTYVPIAFGKQWWDKNMIDNLWQNVLILQSVQERKRNSNVVTDSALQLTEILVRFELCSMGDNPFWLVVQFSVSTEYYCTAPQLLLSRVPTSIGLSKAICTLKNNSSNKIILHWCTKSVFLPYM